jgi:predicted amidophosphoribosyltransferase
MFAVSGVSSGDKRAKCPSCAEWVQASAKVCKHCGRDIPQQ